MSNENNNDKKPSSPWTILSDNGEIQKNTDNNKKTDENKSDKPADEKPAENKTDKPADKTDKKPVDIVKKDEDKKPENKADITPAVNSEPEKSKKISKDFIKSLGTTGFAIIMALVVALAVIPINLLASRLNVEWDMTPNALYTGELSDISKELISTITEPVDIYFLLDKEELEGDYEVGLVLKNILEKYDEYDNINVISGDPDENPELFSEFADEYETLNKGDVIVKGSNGLSKQILSTNLFVTEPLTSDADSEDVNDYQYRFVGENYITGAIQYVTEGTEPYIYFLKGHNEKTITEDYTTLTQIFESYGYVVDDINLTTTPEIPEQTQVLVIAAPQTDITNSEYELIKTYLDGGGHVAFMLSPNGDETDYTNIDALMYDFAIGIDYDRVYESDENMYMSGDKYTIAAYLNDENDENLTWVTEARSLIDQGYSLVMPPSRSFYSYDEVASSNSALTSEPIIYSSSTARAENYGGVDKVGNFTDGEILYLAAYAQDTSRNDAKILVWGNAEFADDEMYEAGYTVTSLSAFISSVAWLHNSSIDMGIGERALTLDYMQIDTKATANKILVVIILIPIIVAGIGVVVWIRRKNA